MGERTSLPDLKSFCLAMVQADSLGIPIARVLRIQSHEMRTKRAIIENSRHVMLVVDHSKFGRNAMVNMGSISMVDAVYTDVMPPAGVMQVIAEHNIQLELC